MHGRISKEAEINVALTVLIKEEYAGSMFQNVVMEPAKRVIGHMPGEFKNDVHEQG